MLLSEQNEVARKFFESCLDILSTKGQDYCPDNEALKEVYRIAQETGSTPRKVLWVYFRKHVTALQTWVLSGAVASEPIEGRLQDLANYAALFRVLIEIEKTLNNAPSRSC